MSGLPILALPSASLATVVGNLPGDVAPLFRDEMVPALWAAALDYTIDPVGMIAQAAKETGWGRYAGRVKPWFYNTAGIKVRHVADVRRMIADELGVPLLDVSIDHPLVHQQFPNWQVGAVAHAQHLRAYAGSPVFGMIVDPRYTLVGPPAAVTWADLSGRWDGGGPGSTYGLDIERIMRELAAT